MEHYSNHSTKRKGPISLSQGIKVMVLLAVLMALVCMQGLMASNVLAAENINRELTSTDIPDATLLTTLRELADSNKDGKLTVGEMKDYSGDLHGELDLSGKEITNIQGLGFAKSVKSINLSGLNLTTIPASNFADCKLENIVLPSTITSIQNSAFEGCSELKTIKFPSKLLTIGDKAFNNCINLKDVDIPDSVTSLGIAAFAGTSIEYIHLNNPNISIGESCFKSCKNLDDIILPEGITVIPVGCFRDSKVSEIDIPNSVILISDQAFMGTGLLNIDLSECNKLVTIGTSAFSASAIDSILLPESLSQLGKRAFENCYNLKEITLPSKITTIEELTFSNNISETSPEGYGYALERVNFTPTYVNGKKTYNLREIKESAFNRCFNLGGDTGNADFLKDLDQLAIIGDKAFYGCSYKVGTKKDKYGIQIYSGVTRYVLPPNVVQIGENAFAYTPTLESINIPDKVTNIATKTFDNCRKLRDVDLPSNLKTIGQYAFNKCYELEDLAFPSSLEEIGNYAFLECGLRKSMQDEDKNWIHEYKGLENLVLPDSISSIGVGAFKSCINLKNVYLPKNLKEISNSTFEGCYAQLKDEKNQNILGGYQSIEKVVFPENVEKIGSSAFKNARNFNFDNANLGNTVTQIGANAFENCECITKLTIPSSLEIIGASAFSGCSGLQELTLDYASNLTTIGGSAFKNADVRGVLRWPDKVTTAAESVFEGNDNLLGVEFPDTVTSVGKNSFRGCFSMTTVTIPAYTKIVNLTDSSFNWCNSLSTVVVKAVPADLSVSEHNRITVPVKVFKEITKVEMDDESIAIAELNTSGTSYTLNIDGVQEGNTKINITGIVEYQVTDPVTKKVVGVNPIASTVQFNVNVTAKRCTNVYFKDSMIGVKLGAKVKLAPVIEPEDTTDLKEWTTDNESIVTVDQEGNIEAKGYGTGEISLKVGGQPAAKCTVRVCAPLSSLAFKNAAVNVVLGESETLELSTSYSSTYKEIAKQFPDVLNWYSSNPEVATVDQAGNITTKGYGTTTITVVASAAKITKTCTVNVVPTYTKVSFNKTELCLEKGKSDTIEIILDPIDSPMEGINFSISPTGIASYSRKGNVVTVSAVKPGKTLFTAKPYNGLAADCVINVVSPLVTISADPIVVNKGAKKTIIVKKQPTDATDTLIFTSRDTNIATVDEKTGQVTGVAGGVVEIDIKSLDRNVATTCTVTVQVPVTGVKLNTTSTEVGIEDTIQLIADILPADATNKDVVWTSSDSTIASVDNEGIVTGIAPGTAKITVKTASGGKTATCTVKVVKLNINGWKVVGDNYYYYIDGIKQKGWLTVDGYLRYFDEMGALARGWKDVSGYTRYFDGNGILTRGWMDIDGYTRYFDENGILTRGWADVDGWTRYFDENGVLTRGWADVDGWTRYFDENGVLTRGWADVSGWTRYFDENGVLTRGWAEIGGYIRYFDENGVLTRGWAEIGGYIRYFDENGVLTRGWAEIGGYIRYFDENGIILKGGWYMVEGYERYFYEEGYIALDTVVDGWYVDENGIKTSLTDDGLFEYETD